MEYLNNLTLCCRVITPLFMRGANLKDAEIRSFSLKGMMRWWWRAIRSENNIEKLKKEESEIFGGSGEEQKASKIWIKVIGKKLKKGFNLKNDEELNWRFNRETRSLEGDHAGIGYLLYSTVLPERERTYIKVNSTFEVKISSFDEKAFKNAVASLWASIYLGGFGTRARRGGGNVIVEDVKGNDSGLSFILKANSSEELAKWIVENFKKAKNLICENGTQNFVNSYSNLSFSRFIISSESFNNWISALNDIGIIFSSFRSEYRREIFDLAVFGLPVVHRSGIVEGRRASPLIFKILCSNSKFYWFVLRLSGEFLPEGKVIKFKDKTQKPDYRLIEEFWNSLKEKGKEYILNKPGILDKAIEKIKRDLNPSKIILYGSRARGDAYKKSDIDIAVETDESVEKLSLEGNFDIVSLKKANKDLKERIEKEGVILYERKG